jgi:hypothetical protein
MTPNQLIAYNLTEARRLQGLTQEQAAEKLEPFIGERWSVPVFSAAERSVTGKRIREFSADDVVAFSRAFDLPVSFFFKPPPDADSINHGRAPGSGESPINYFKRAIALDESKNAWLLEWLGRFPGPTRNRLRWALDERTARAGEDTLAHELEPVIEWAERLHDMGTQLETVREIVETKVLGGATHQHEE